MTPSRTAALVTCSLLFVGRAALASPFAYVTNDLDSTVSVIDTATTSVTGTIDLGAAGVTRTRGVAVSPSGLRVYVAGLLSGNVGSIDAVTQAVTPIPLTALYNFPAGLAVSAVAPRLYVANFQHVSVIDTSSNTDVADIPVTITVGGDSTEGIAVSPDGSRVYATQVFSSAISVIDTATNSEITTIPNGGSRMLAFDPSGSLLYACGSPGGPSDVRVIDPSTNTIIDTIPTSGVCPTVNGMAINPSGSRLYTTCGISVAVIDTATRTILTTVPIGNTLFGVDITPDGSRVYVVNEGDETVAVIDTVTNAVVGAPIPVGSQPFGYAGRFIGPAFSCGNGAVEPGESCDDHGTTGGDGCSATCTVETGWTCTGEPSACTPVCGDSMTVGSEVCDDGPANGLNRCCSATCTLADADGDGTCDRDDPCPHVVAVTPTAMIGVKRVRLGYARTGPGGNDDVPRIFNAQFSTGAVFDPDSTHSVHVAMTNTGNGARIFAADLAPGGFWSQPRPTKKIWGYRDPTRPVPANGVRTAGLNEMPAGSGNFQLQMQGKGANLSAAGAPLNPATDDLRLLVEIEAGGAGVCFERTLTTCANMHGATDVCTQ